MELLNAQLERIKTQLAGLTLTQRMLVGTLVALMGITVYYWGHYASNPEMVPVLDTNLNGNDMAVVEHALQEQGITYVPSGGQILVPSDRKMDIVANLAYSNQLPHDSAGTFQAIMKDLNPFSPPSDRDLHYTQYLQQTLEDMIHRWREVGDVAVVLNTKEEYRIDGSLKPSATVNITTHEAPAGSKVFHKLVDAASAAVASAVPGLTPANVTVIVDERRGRGKDDDSDFGGGSDLVEAEQSYEEDKERRIRDAFPDIPALNVSVCCEVNNSTVSSHKTTFDPKNTITKDTQVDEKEDDTKGGAGAGAEPGVGANTSATIPTASASGGGGGPESTSTETKTTSQVLASSEESNTSTPAGKPKVLSAALRIPRSYFVEICKKLPSAPEPTDAMVNTTAEAEMGKIRESVQHMLELTPDAVSVQTYTDVAPTLAMAAAPSLVAGNTPNLSTVTGHAKQIGVLALAVLSLFMMSSMVRKATPAPVVMPESARVDVEPPVLNSGEMLAGEAGVSDATLDGMELDDDAVRAQQMLDQVSTLVKENPDSAAVLVKRWLNRS